MYAIVDWRVFVCRTEDIEYLKSYIKKHIWNRMSAESRAFVVYKNKPHQTLA